MAEHNDFGRHCEQMAAEYLVKKGYRILDTNWRVQHLEIDIIASISNLLVVVEVRSRSSNTPIQPEETITPTKIKRIVRATQAYIQINNINMDIRFDVITLIYNSETQQYSLRHTEDAFLPPLNI